MFGFCAARARLTALPPAAATLSPTASCLAAVCPGVEGDGIDRALGLRARFGGSSRDWLLAELWREWSESVSSAASVRADVISCSACRRLVHNGYFVHLRKDTWAKIEFLQVRLGMTWQPRLPTFEPAIVPCNTQSRRGA